MIDTRRTRNEDNIYKYKENRIFSFIFKEQETSSLNLSWRIQSNVHLFATLDRSDQGVFLHLIDDTP